MSEEVYSKEEVDSLMNDTLQELESASDKYVKAAEENVALREEVKALKDSLKKAEEKFEIELQKVASAPGVPDEVISGIVECLQDASILSREKSAGFTELLQKDASNIVETFRDTIKKLSSPTPRSGKGVAKQANTKPASESAEDENPWREVVESGVR